MTSDRQLHFNLFGTFYGDHRSAWRHPDAVPGQAWDLEFLVATALTAERGLFDAVFLADSPTLGELNARTTTTRPEPITLLSALAGRTQHIGLAATVSTTYAEPYNVARQIASLDGLSRGRAGWNIVTGSQASAASNFGPTLHPDHALRYERSEEFIEIVTRLWESWDPDAVIGDQDAGIWVDPAKIRRVPYQGQHFELDALFNVPRSPQGRPILFHAGSSDLGRDQGARWGDGIFTAQPTLDSAREFYADYKRRAAIAGRSPDEVLIFPGFLAVVGDTEEQAHRIWKQLNDWIDIDASARQIRTQLGIDLDGVNLDGPIPDDVWNRAGKSFTSRVAVIRRLAIEENLTARQVVQHTVSAFGHYVRIGTPEQIAADIELWFTTGAADGFNVKTPTVPTGLEAFVDHVVPLLQRKGLFREGYEGTTLRSHYGLPELAPALV